MEKVKAAVTLFEVYTNKMAEKKRYDYQDMILWVIRAFKENPNLLLSYREQYQFLLVDEFQDTNGAQNTILDMLAGDAADQPNVFVVGDDDQSIFRFQGASITNIMDFNHRYQEQVALVVLTDNYRSSQRILNASEALIGHNEDRLTNKISDLDKHLEAKGVEAHLEEPVNVLVFDNEHAEEIGVFEQIRVLLNKGVSPSEIAVVYRQHRHIDRLRKKMDIEKTPYNIRRRENILDLSLIRHVRGLLRYIQMEYEQPMSADYLLLEILHYPYFKIPALDIGKMAAWMRTQEADQRPSWRELISDAAQLAIVGIEHVGPVLNCSSFLEEGIKHRSNLTVQNLLEYIVDAGGILNYILEHDEQSTMLRVLTTLYDFLKERSAKDSKRDLASFIVDLDKMSDHGLALPVNIEITKAEGINMVTAHSAKGLEFDYVFIIGSNENKWEKSSSGNYNFKLPPNLTESVQENKEAEERRLFYVAMTRSRKGLYISYAKQDMRNKDLHASRFVSELEQHPDVVIEERVLDRDVVDSFAADLFKFRSPASLDTRNVDWLDEILKRFALSPTALNKYLDCPVRFYYENLLRIPRARTAGMGFGSAVHYALEQFFNKKQGQLYFPESDVFLNLFYEGMAKYRSHFTDKEFEDLSEYGRQILPQYLQAKLPAWNKIPQSRTEYPVNNIEIDGVPVSGMFDRVDLSGNVVRIIDYKTGKYSYNTRKRLKGPEPDPDHKLKETLAIEKDPDERHKLKMKLFGEDYWRQMVFYKLLMAADTRQNWQMSNAAISFVEAVDNYDKDPFNVPVGIEDEQVVIEQITETYKNIMAKSFDNGCRREHCQWCSLVAEIGEPAAASGKDD
jgi:DNA helicase-2/ATP-dependent DNA helicase PcrA